MLARALTELWNLNIQFFADLVLNNLLWLFIFVAAYVFLTDGKQKWSGLLMLFVIMFAFYDFIYLFNMPSFAMAFPITASAIMIGMFAFSKGTKLEPWFLTIAFAILLVGSWLFLM